MVPYGLNCYESDHTIQIVIVRLRNLLVKISKFAKEVNCYHLFVFGVPNSSNKLSLNKRHPFNSAHVPACHPELDTNPAYFFIWGLTLRKIVLYVCLHQFILVKEKVPDRLNHFMGDRENFLGNFFQRYLTERVFHRPE